MSQVDDGLAARRAALAAIRAVEEDGSWSNLAVPAAVADLPTARDRAFASHLAYDTLRWRDTLDHALAQASARPLDDIEPALLRILRFGAVQVLRSGVPARAAVDTSVALAREAVPRRRADGAAGFVNGVLRTVARRAQQAPRDTPTGPVASRLALDTGHPTWVVRDLLGRYGPDRTRAILDADNRSPGVTLRATGDAATLLAELVDAGVDATPGSVPGAIRAPGADPRRLAAVGEGRAVVQDEASMRVVLATGVQPGDRVLDLCAGPGGKTAFLAALAGPGGHVIAVEQHPHRAELVERLAQRVGVDVEVVVGDAAVEPSADHATTEPASTAEPATARSPQDVGTDGYDVVLLDAPCTGLGTGRRRPEVRWRRQPKDAADLAAVQRRLLFAAAERVRPGGRLTYAVCTWTVAETDAVADALDAAHDGLDPVDRVQLLPDVHGTDGMFIATWVRRPRETSGVG